MFLFDQLLLLRQNALKRVESLSTAQLNLIPEGHKNNIIWQLGHIVASQQSICYMRGGLTPPLPLPFIEKYRNGSHPMDWEKAVSLDEIKPLLLETIPTLEKDYKEKKLDAYQRYTTPSGITFENIDDALLYNFGHENFHYGNITTMIKIVSGLQ